MSDYYRSGSERSGGQVALESAYKALCEGNPVAEMVLALHAPDEGGRCLGCLTESARVEGAWDRRAPEVAWPCATADAVRHAVLGWSIEHVQMVKERVVDDVLESGKSLLDDDFYSVCAARFNSWVESGIPAHRAVLYVSAGITAPEAIDLQARHEAGEDVDPALATLSALATPAV